jgi:hypothetical protein
MDAIPKIGRATLFRSIQEGIGWQRLCELKTIAGQKNKSSDPSKTCRPPENSNLKG